MSLKQLSVCGSPHTVVLLVVIRAMAVGTGSRGFDYHPLLSLSGVHIVFTLLSSVRPAIILFYRGRDEQGRGGMNQYCCRDVQETPRVKHADLDFNY